MTKVAMIVWNDFQNDARVLKEAETLQNAEFDVTVYAVHVTGKTLREERLGPRLNIVRTPAGIRSRQRRASGGQAGSMQPSAVTQFARAAGRGFAHLRILWKIIRLRPDVVHAHDINTLPTAWAAAAITRARLVYDAHEISTDREGYASIRQIVGWLERRIMPSTWANITTTDSRAKFFARAYGIARPVVLQNRPRYQLTPRANRIRAELSLAEDRPIILYQGMLQRGRGLELLMECVSQIEDVYLVLIGGGKLEQQLRERIGELGISETVHIIPTVPLKDLPEYTASADVGVQPLENTCLNHFTTDSNKLFEYMMAGLPVVASNFPEIRAVVNRAGWGILVPPGDCAALRIALTRLSRDGELRARMSREARALAQEYNWEKQEDRLLSIYQQVTPSA